ncbi:MAG TPA: hypothetical protein VII47_06060, partial [Actinomycetota bacterium]
MSQDEEEQVRIAHELSETQARLAEAVEALAYKKVHLKDDARALAEEKKEAILDSLRDKKDEVLEKAAEKKDEVLEKAGEKKDEVLETLKEKVAEATQAVADKLGGAKDA